MKTKQCFLAMLSALTLLLSSCSGGGADEVEYIAFRDGEGLWGLVSPKGEVLFEGRFKNKPSLVLHGVFSVKNDKGAYEVYTAEAEPKQVGETYSSIGDFFDGVAPAVNAKALGINPEEYTRPDFLATTKEIPEGSFETFVQFSDYMMIDGNPRTFRTDLNADEITATLTLYNATPTMCEGFFKQLVRHIAKVCGNNPDEADNFTTIENKFFTPEGHTIDLLRKNNVFELRMWDEPDMDIADEDNEMI